MKKYFFKGILMLVLVIVVISCEKEQEIEKVEVENESQIELRMSSTLNPNNPYDNIGQKMYGFLTYIDPYIAGIEDEEAYCPIEYAASGELVYDIETKSINRVQQYCAVNGIATGTDGQYNMALESFNPGTAHAQLDELVMTGEISPLTRNVLVDYNNSVKVAANVNEVISISINTENYLNANAASFTTGELQMLFTTVSAIKHTAYYAQDNGMTGLPMMPINLVDPCGTAAVVYSASLVGLCLATGPVGWIVGGIGFASGIWGLVEDC